MKSRVLVAVSTAAMLALAACGSSTPGAGAGSSGPSGGTGGMGATGGMSPSGGPMTFSFGEPGKPGQVTKTVAVSMLDTLKFDPATVSVKMGETVKFDITNTGATVHEFVLGDQATQDEEEAQMAAGSMMTAPNAVRVQPGESATVIWKFTVVGSLLYGCHEPGHYAGGMVGTIGVSS